MRRLLVLLLVALTWQSPASGPVTGYRIYRDTTPFALAPLATVGNVAVANVATFSDTATVPGVLYYYVVKAYNAAGEGPASNYGRMVAK